MAIELKQTVKLSQQLLITPQLQQAIKLLQLSRAELIETVQKELLENPVLEESEERQGAENAETVATPEIERHSDLSTSSSESGSSDHDVESADPRSMSKEFDWGNFVEANQSYKREPRSFSDNSEDLPNYENMLSSVGSLKDHLEWQIKMGSMLPEERDVCETLIGNLDDNGYLRVSLEELSEKTPYTHDELEDGLCIIQDLDPPGVGARDLKECLKIQVRDSGPDRSLLENIIENYLDLIEKRNYQALGKRLGLTPKRTKDLADIIFSLEPKPGRSYTKGDTQYIVPDIYVQKVGTEFVVMLNEDGLPKLQISNLYKKAIMNEVANKNGQQSTHNDKITNEAQNYIQEKLKNALWLIKSIHQRQKTLYKVTKSITAFQKEFLENGVNSLKPLVLRDVADEIGVHESTVSRATNGKYVHTPQGIFELKYFFNTGLSNSAGGEDFANEAVKQMIKQYISVENLKAPLSDQALALMLKRQNINIARRTVAKYREMLGILPSSRRKRLYWCCNKSNFKLCFLFTSTNLCSPLFPCFLAQIFGI